MSEVTSILSQIDQGNAAAADQLLPLVYNELRRLAAARLANEKPGQTMSATSLVHEAYLRLVGDRGQQDWGGQAHFFSAAAESMRRILVESARRKGRLKHGGELQRVELPDVPVESGDPFLILAVNDALDQLAAEDATAAAVVKLHFFAGLSLDETASALGMSRANAYRQWTYARAWLKPRLPHQKLDA